MSAAGLKPAPLPVRLHSLLVEHGGSIARPHLERYLAELLHASDVDVRDEIINGVTDGRYAVSWTPPSYQGEDGDLESILRTGALKMRLALPDAI